jgi:hypothetical protein
MKYIFISAIVIIAVFLAVLSQIPLAIEPLSELYFENHTQFRENIFPDREYNFSFTIHNLEYQKMRYEYFIGAFDVNNSLIMEIDEGEVLLEDNESVTIFQEYSLPKDFLRAKVLITITKDHLNITPEFKKKLWWPDPNYPNEIEIHFWVDEVVPTRIIRIPDN